jgi:hypothetical protein
MNISFKPAPALVLVLLALTACGGSGGSAEAAVPARTSTQYVVAVDLSTSLTPTERAHHETLLKALAADLDYGDQLVLVKAHAAGVRDTSTVRTVSMPELRGSRPLQQEKDALGLQRQTAEMAVTSLFKNAPTHGSDLFATLHSAGERARENNGKRKVLFVLSDMLQCAGSVCMERADGLRDSAWIAVQKQEGLVPPLDQVCVSVVGADASTSHGVKVRQFWNDYFRTAGASFSPNRYMHSASSPAVLRCDA